MRLGSLLPRNVVRLKNEFLLALRYGHDPRFRRLACSDAAGRYVSYAVSAGLANRLRSHYLASIVARATGRTVFPIWLATKELASDGHDIFPQSLPTRSQTRPFDARLISATKLMQELPSVLRDDEDRVLMLNFDAQWQPFEESRNLLGATEPVVVQVDDKIVADARRIVATLGDSYISVHVRQGDFLTHTGFAKPLAYFEEHVRAARQRSPAAECLLIASDEDVSVSPPIAALFAKTVVLTPTFKRTEHGVAAEALAHLLALAEATEFVPSPMSSFSEFVLALRSRLIRLEGVNGR
jgi:hypothetical protein